MDGLALLCNLHADGPLSLRRLRDSGIRSLEELARETEPTLAEMLKASPSQVRRFLHEGRLLNRRLEEQPLESEFNTDEPIPGEVRARLMKHVVSPIVAYDVGPPDPESGASEDDEPEQEPSVDLGPTLFDDAEGQPEVVSIQVTPTPLKIGEIPGLDSRTCQQLVAQGVRTYKALVDLANLNLARRTGIPFTRLLDLRHHARHLLQARLSRGPARESGIVKAPVVVERVTEAGPVAAPAHEPEPTVELIPRPRRLAETQSKKIIPLLRDPLEESPASPSPPAPEPTAPGPSAREPGVAGPFV